MGDEDVGHLLVVREHCAGGSHEYAQLNSTWFLLQAARNVGGARHLCLSKRVQSWLDFWGVQHEVVSRCPASPLHCTSAQLYWQALDKSLHLLVELQFEQQQRLS